MPSVPPNASFDASRMMRYDANKRSALIAYMLWFFLGYLGLHRFYLGRTASGAVMLGLTIASAGLTIIVIGYFGFMLAGLWWLVDALLIPGMAQDYNNRLIASLG